MSASFDFAKGSFPDVLTYRIVTDASTFYHRLFHISRVSWYVMSRLAHGVWSRDLSKVTSTFRMLGIRVKFWIKLGRAYFSRLNTAELRKRLIVEVSGRFKFPCVLYTSKLAHAFFLYIYGLLTWCRPSSFVYEYSK